MVLCLLMIFGSSSFLAINVTFTFVLFTVCSVDDAESLDVVVFFGGDFLRIDANVVLFVMVVVSREKEEEGWRRCYGEFVLCL